MINSLTPTHLQLLRRCDGGLRLWESGDARKAVLAELDVLSRLGVVMFEEGNGYVLTPLGDATLARLDR